MDAHHANSFPRYGGRIIAASLAMLCLVVLCIFIIHLYARWFCRSSSRRQAFLWSIRLHHQQQSALLSNADAGLDKALLDSMPIFRYHALSVDGGDSLECAVCLSEFQENEEGRIMPNCKHSFHTACIDVWFRSHSTCPLCRTAVVAHGNSGSPERSQIDQQVSQQHPREEQDADRTSLPSLPFAGWGWRRSTSDRLPQSHGVQFPTNVLFWGDHAQVTSRVNTPVLEPGNRGDLFRPMVITIGEAAIQETGHGNQACRVDLQQQNESHWRHPGAHLSTITRLLSCRERKVYPLGQANETTIGSTSNTVDARV